MVQEDKQLLLKDLCARLPYNVIIRCTDSDTNYKCFLTTDILHEIQNDYEYYDYKPYLRPMSSMTEEERNEWMEITHAQEWLIIGNLDKATDWLNEHHFDHRGLIPMELALEATEGMYKER